jgi:hypothetical protein
MCIHTGKHMYTGACHVLNEGTELCNGIDVRAFFHAIVLGVYIAFWNICYIQLVDLGTDLCI